MEMKRNLWIVRARPPPCSASRPPRRRTAMWWTSPVEAATTTTVSRRRQLWRTWMLRRRRLHQCPPLTAVVMMQRQQQQLKTRHRLGPPVPSHPEGTQVVDTVPPFHTHTHFSHSVHLQLTLLPPGGWPRRPEERQRERELEDPY